MNTRKTLTGLTAIALTGLMTFTTSCDKLKDKLFESFSANGGSVDFTIPVISDTGVKKDMGSESYNLNIDSIIKAQTGGAFSLNDIDAVEMEECILKINNPDADNNIQNFEEGWITFSTNSNPASMTVATGLVPDVYATEFAFPPVSGANLKSYLTGNVLTYAYQAKMRKATTKELDATLKVKLRIK